MDLSFNLLQFNSSHQELLSQARAQIIPTACELYTTSKHLAISRETAQCMYASIGLMLLYIMQNWKLFHWWNSFAHLILILTFLQLTKQARILTKCFWAWLLRFRKSVLHHWDWFPCSQSYGDCYIKSSQCYYSSCFIKCCFRLVDWKLASSM